MSFAINLVLFEPARHVFYGMPIFTSTDAELLRYLLMNYGEWGDNTTTWHANCHIDGAHMELLCRLHTDEGPSCRNRLTPSLWTSSIPWRRRMTASVSGCPRSGTHVDARRWTP
jgi:hypothetical protein